MITVYHNSKFLQLTILQIMGTESASMIDPELLVPVAIVDGDLDAAFRLVQHLDKPWYDNPQIQVLKRSRSTSVGDVLRKDDGTCWLVKGFDFEQIENLQLPEIPGIAKKKVKENYSMSALLNAFKNIFAGLQLWKPVQPHELKESGDQPDFGTDVRWVTEYEPKRYLLADPKSDAVRNAYQRLGLGERDAQSTYEAAVKLLVEHGTLDTCEGFIVMQVFKNDDFIICYYQHLSIQRIGALHKNQQIWLGDIETGEIFESSGSLATFGRLQNLADGRALAVTYPHISQWKSTATTCLELLYLVLENDQEKGDFKIESAKYRIEQKGNTLSLRDKQNMLLLEGDVITIQSEHLEIKVKTSYLSIVDAETISQEFKHTYKCDDIFEYEDNAEIARTLPNGKSLAWGAIHAVPISRIDIDRSWTVPLGELLPRNVDDEVTEMAVMQAARLILGKNDGRDFTGIDYRIINRSLEYPINIEIQDNQGNLLLEWKEITGIINNGITIKVAREIMIYAQEIPAKLHQDDFKEPNSTEQGIGDFQGSPIAVVEA